MRMSATKSALPILSGALVATGCLFPSFDDMKSSPKGGIAEKADSNVTEANASAPNATDAVDASTVDAGSSSASTSTSTIACEDDAGACSADGTSFCCATVGGPKCQGPGTEGFCTGVEGGKILRCDDRGDCPGSDVCCFLAGAKEAACMPGCAGALLCSKDDPTCPTGKSCTGVINGGSFSSSFCQ